MPFSCKMDLNKCPSLSSPTTVAKIGLPPNAFTFNATLAAPPNRSSSVVTSTIGTGASGEILLTSPKT